MTPQPKKRSADTLQGVSILLLSVATLVLFATGHHRIMLSILAAVVVFLWVWRIVHFRKAAASSGWPATPARISRMLQLRHYSKYGKGAPYLVVEYEYDVDWQSYRNDLYTLFPWSAERRMATLPDYQQQPTMTIHYNPDNPIEAVEKPGKHAPLVSPFAIGLTLFSVLFITLYWVFLL